MRKFALLIGVSEYQHGLSQLNGVVQDLEKMQRVLLHLDMGGFAKDDVTVLKNPEKIEMEKAIEQLFSNRDKDDLVLLYFAGHGILDFNSNKFYITNSKTERDIHKNLVKATATEATWIKDRMNESRSRRMVVILDSCFSGAFAMKRAVRSADITVDIKTQLGGEGRAILASSSATEYSQEESSGGIYTSYIVEGIETGAADTDNDGYISVQELHEFAFKKVHEAAPAMKPQIETSQEGYKIKIAKAPEGDLKLKLEGDLKLKLEGDLKLKLEYRKKVEESVINGEITGSLKEYLKVVQEIYKLSDDDAGQIEKQVLEPHQKYQESLRLYEGNYTKIISDGKIPEQQKHKVLKDLQQLLNLRDEDVKPIHDRLISPANNPPETPPTPPQTDNLSSEKGIDYTTLRDLLAAQKWQEADKETYEVMIKAVSKKSGDWLTSDELLNFPCKDLRTIDQLWVKYSKGKFGFSVQKEIYLSVGGKADGKYYSDAWGKFVEKVGWKDEVTYDASPHGHLPFDIIYLSLINLKSRSLLSSLASRLVNCNI